ncbi:MAG: hypothetical protein Q4C79_09415 [Neisseria sp.]|uniref:hypothetical protein n=1 Tax=Neisseria sp. TaxID=192066 RepID=UPI0026DD3A81|nr:hypothetical protein [Neisseria sp.]MDO4249154.1 hypothetical protein [Neisseria sp.]
MDDKDKQAVADPTQEQAEQTRRAKAKIRTIRIWFWVVISMFLGFFFLSQCAMSKPKAKEVIIESCVKNVPYSEKWQQDLQANGLAGQSDKVILDYCVCMWNEPLDKLNHNQLKSMSKISAEEQLALLGGADAFNARDKQCIAKLGAAAK